MRRVLSVYLPYWPTERAARRLKPADRQPILLVAAKGDRRLVMHASPEAIRAGVIRGMHLAHARALIVGAEPIVELHRPARDGLALESLAHWAMRWSPVVAPDQPDGLLLDITGCGHLFGGDRGLATSLRSRLRALGFTARVAVAANVGVAWGVSRFGPAAGVIVRPGREREAMASLPVQALRIGDDVAEALHEVGISTVGEVVALARASLPARYGNAVIRRLNHAFGEEYEAVIGVRESVPLQAHLELAGAATQWEGVALAVRHLLEELIGLLERQESGLRRLDARFQRLDSVEVRIVVQVSRPTRSGKHLWSLLRPKLERLNLGYGVTGIFLSAAGVVRITHSQGTLVGEDARSCENDAAISQTVDAIMGRMGPDRICRFSLRESHRPEAAASVVQLIDSGAAPRAHSSLLRALGSDRPSILHAEPERVRVIALSPDGPVLSVARGGDTRRIIASAGPERIDGEWWRAREPQRDYFRVQDESGRWLWIFRESQHAAAPGGVGGWFIHGEWA